MSSTRIVNRLGDKRGWGTGAGSSPKKVRHSELTICYTGMHRHMMLGTLQPRPHSSLLHNNIQWNQHTESAESHLTLDPSPVDPSVSSKGHKRCSQTVYPSVKNPNLEFVCVCHGLLRILVSSLDAPHRGKVRLTYMAPVFTAVRLPQRYANMLIC